MGLLNKRLSAIILLISLMCAHAQDTRTSTMVMPSQPSAPAIAQVSPQPTANKIDTPALLTWPLESLPVGVPKTASGKPIPCSPKNTKLNPTTHKLISECAETTFCSAPPGSPVNATGLGICFPRLCRRDEFPFGYGTYGGGSGGKKVQVKGQPLNDSAIVLPPLCSTGQFCPDNGSGCKPVVKSGEKCELARDEQCELPPRTGDKSVCLNKICMAATLTLNDHCTIENTSYVSDINRGAAGGGQFTTFVFKHNCLAPGYYCSPNDLANSASGGTCQETKKLGDKCKFDAECELNNCLSSNRCGPPPQTPIKLSPWHWVATVLAILISMTAACLVLLFIHRRRQYAAYQEVKTYYHEQTSLRRSILALHAAAAEQQSLKKTVYSEKKSIVTVKEKI